MLSALVAVTSVPAGPDWAVIVAGLTGLGGIAGTLLGARMAGSSEGKRSLRAEKIRAYAQFRTAEMNMLMALGVLQGHYDPNDPHNQQNGLAEVNESIQSLLQAQSLLSLVGSEPASSIAHALTAHFANRRDEIINSSVQPDPNFNGRYGEISSSLLTVMHIDLDLVNRRRMRQIRVHYTQHVTR